MLSNLLVHPLARGIDPDSVHSIETHRQIMESKALMRAVYDSWYGEMKKADEASQSVKGMAIELGCGASYLEKFIPDLIKTDIVLHQNCVKKLNAEKLDLENDSVRAIYMTGVLHHIENPENFFSEASRVLREDGRILMIEPSDSPLHKIMTNLCNPHEFYDDSVKSWKNTPTGRMSRANNAIPSLIFRRDVQLFKEKFPKLQIEYVRNHTFLSYYVTGGMSYISFLPAIALPLVQGIEICAKPFFPYLGTMMSIHLRKIA